MLFGQVIGPAGGRNWHSSQEEPDLVLRQRRVAKELRKVDQAGQLMGMELGQAETKLN